MSSVVEHATGSVGRYLAQFEGDLIKRLLIFLSHEEALAGAAGAG